MAEDTVKATEDVNLLNNSRRYSETRRVIRVFVGRKLALIGLIIVFMMIIMAIFAPWLAPHDPYRMDIVNKLKQPSWEHPFGTDSLGRDTLSRIIYGTRTSLVVGIGAVGIAAITGVILGLSAAYFGGIVFIIIMRLTDALMATPMILNALIISAVLGGGLKNVVIALSVGMISGQCRMMCGQAMTIKQNEYVLAARAIGASDMRIMFKHILLNAFPPLLVITTIGLGTAILAEASLSFLGLGIAPPQPAWGSMINDGYQYLLTRPMLSIAPGIAIAMIVFGFNMVGDGLRDALDPRLRGTI